jgi:hypothetical protein
VLRASSSSRRWSRTIRPRSAPDLWTAAAVLVASLLVIDAALLPWHRSGSVERNAFELARVAERLDLVDSLGRRVLFVAVYVMPLLVSVALLAALDRRRRTTGIAVLAAGMVSLVGAAVVLSFGGNAPVGVDVGFALGLLAVVCGGRLIRRRSTR